MDIPSIRVLKLIRQAFLGTNWTFDSKNMELQNLILITGGASSGKSAFAEKLAGEPGSLVTYLATMPNLADDPELAAKIDAHKSRRPSSWNTVESTTDVKGEVKKLPDGPGIVILDCLSAFVTNLVIELEKNHDEVLEETRLVVDALSRRDDWKFIFVTNEVGSGIVPENKLARSYRELLGRVNQLMAQRAAHVYLCACGIPVKIK